MERMQWKGKLEFLFAGFGYTIGLGNIWRFPYRCYVNGGGAFLIPYFIATIFCTFPLLLMEMLLGQFASEGPVTIWRFCPIFEGVGWAMLFNVFITNISYIVIVMYAMFYMLVAFVNIGQPLPWQQCDSNDVDKWNTRLCRVEPFPNFDALDTESSKIDAYIHLLKTTCNVTRTATMTFLEFKDIHKYCEIGYTSPEEEYWNRFVLESHESDGVNDLGAVSGRNVLALLLVWVIVFYCCMKGVRSLSKVRKGNVNRNVFSNMISIWNNVCMFMISTMILIPSCLFRTLLYVFVEF